ncbi:MAG: hypothetical protein HC905_02900 [Bacteroidales bacterium]|nr:hypothetical protein [Bacteroidales bacterium]
MKPSGITADTTMITTDSTALISDTETSPIFGEILKIIGRVNKADIKHVDNAYKENCKIFITNDRNDIISKKEKLQELTGMKFFHSDDLIAIEQCIKSMFN